MIAVLNPGEKVKKLKKEEKTKVVYGERHADFYTAGDGASGL